MWTAWLWWSAPLWSPFTAHPAQSYLCCNYTAFKMLADSANLWAALYTYSDWAVCRPDYYSPVWCFKKNKKDESWGHRESSRANSGLHSTIFISMINLFDRPAYALIKALRRIRLVRVRTSDQMIFCAVLIFLQHPILSYTVAAGSQ